MSRTFNNLTPEECFEAYEHVRKNAESHFEAAQVLSKHDNYPNSIAHYILGTEEFIKGFMLFLEHKKFNLSTAEHYKKLFYNHRVRHSIISDFFSVWIPVRTLITIPGREVKQSKVDYWLKQLMDIAESFSNAGKNHDWWKTADEKKQQCFYVDYNDGFILPSAFGKEQFEEAKERVLSFTGDVRAIIVCLSRMPEKKIENYRQLVKQAEIPDLLGETFKRATGK